jgi:hypothetical protein
LAEDRGAQIAAVLTAAVGALFELLVSSGVDGGLLAELQRERVPGLLRTSITTTLTGEAAG